MSIEAAMIERARPHMLAEKARAVVRAEASKGCEPHLFRQPVALEPPFRSITCVRELLSGESVAGAVPEAPADSGTLRRLRIWIAPDWKIDWNRSERFLKQLQTVSRRVGFEIVGNSTEILANLLCHADDVPILSAAFQGEHADCELEPLREFRMVELRPSAWISLVFRDFVPLPPYSHLLTCPPELVVSPLEPLITAMSRIPAPGIGIYQALFQPVAAGHNWHRAIEVLTDLEYGIKLQDGANLPQRYAQPAPSGDLRHMAVSVDRKAHNDKPIAAMALRIGVVGLDACGDEHLAALGTCASLFQHGGRPLAWLSNDQYRQVLSLEQIRDAFLRGFTYRPGFLVNSAELAGPVHVPAATFLEHRTAPFSILKSLPVRDPALSKGTQIGTSQHAGMVAPVCVPIRLRHTHVIGRSDMGKSTLLESMILQDIAEGHGVAVLDPHGDLVNRLLYLLPKRELERIIYFDPGDPTWVPLWNPLRAVAGQEPARATDELLFAFKRVVSGWGDRLEHLLRHTFYGLIHLPGATLLDASNLLEPKSEESCRLRQQILEVVENEVARRFWQHDFEHYGKDEFGPPRHKLSKILLSGTPSLMLSQPDNALNLRHIMDNRKILLANLSTVGSDTREFLGCFLLSWLHQSAVARSDVPSDQRPLFHGYCDEAHRFLTDAIEDIFVETRKFGASLTLAHHFMSQFDTSKADAISSVGTTIIFNVDTKDASHLCKDLRGEVDKDDLITLEKGEAVARIGTSIVRIRTPLPAKVTADHCRDLILAESRRRYCKPIAEIRQAIARRYQRWATPFAPLVAPGSETEELGYDTFR